MYEKLLKSCKLCPRECSIDKLNTDRGVCRTKAGYYVASVVVHKGEEPPISGEKGICNVFFAHCNLQCVYCQNYQISKNNTDIERYKMSLSELIDKIVSILDTGINMLGFVSPSHFPLEVIEIVKALYKRGYFPTIVYNTNAYEKVETLRMLEPYVDVYLPDLKYMDSALAAKYSKARDYPQVASLAIKEMIRQKGDDLIIDKNGYAISGVIIRHLVLPSHIENSIAVLRFIASISQNIYISLMSQYFPTADAYKYPEINRTVYPSEYQKVVEEAIRLNLTNGWIQDIQSHQHYIPDFNYDHPFERIE